MKVTRRRERRRKHLLDDLKIKTDYGELKEKDVGLRGAIVLA